jgi:8-oxo-dGTP diphosphatase
MDNIESLLESITLTKAVEGFLSDGKHVCLGLRKRVSSGLGENLMAGIGGKIGDQPEFADESPGEAIDREVREEIDVTVLEKHELGRVRFIFTHKPPDSSWNQDVIVYLITKWQGEPCETESTRPEWVNIDEIPWERMWEDNAHWLPSVLADRQVNAVFIYRDDYRISDYRVK